jgi:hypothetical protein
LGQSTTARTESTSPRLAPILSMVEALRRGANVVISTGKVFHVPFRAPAVVEYKDSVARIHSWENALVAAWQARTVSNADALDLMVLHRYAESSGALRLANRAGSHGWWTETDLARFLRITRKTLRARWQRWEQAGWVESREPNNPNLPLRRWLGKAPVEAQVVG